MQVSQKGKHDLKILLSSILSQICENVHINKYKCSYEEEIH